MMKIKEQVTSLELSKKLKGLGVKQESFIYWTNNRVKRDYREYVLESGTPIITENCYSAFTVAELGLLLPNYVCTYKDENDWFCNPKFKQFTNFTSGVIADTEANARAKCLIYLIENKLI